MLAEMSVAFVAGLMARSTYQWLRGMAFENEEVLSVPEHLDDIENEVKQIERRRKVLAQQCCELLGYEWNGSRESTLARSIVYRGKPVNEVLNDIMMWRYGDGSSRMVR